MTSQDHDIICLTLTNNTNIIQLYSEKEDIFLFYVNGKCYETQFISTESELHTADIEQLTAVSYFSSLHHSIDKQMTLDALVGKGKVKLYCA